MVAMSGLNPVRKQSGSSVNMTRLSKGGSPLVRRFLYMDSKTALPKIPTLQDLYNRLLAKGNTRMQARCAVMRKMLLILRGMVKNDQEFRVLNENLEKCGEIAWLLANHLRSYMVGRVRLRPFYELSLSVSHFKCAHNSAHYPSCACIAEQARNVERLPINGVRCILQTKSPDFSRILCKKSRPGSCFSDLVRQFADF